MSGGTPFTLRGVGGVVISIRHLFTHSHRGVSIKDPIHTPGGVLVAIILAFALFRFWIGRRDQDPRSSFLACHPLRQPVASPTP